MTTIIECKVAGLASGLDLTAVKTKQHAAWSCGDYAVLGVTLQIVGEELVEAMDLRAGQKVLDIAAGNGNVSLAAARRWCEVTSTDYVEALLQRGRLRAEADGLHIDFRHADAEALPFADATFDAAVSTFGVMFTPNQSRAVEELVRVLKKGGRVGLASWTPEGFVGQLFKIVGRYLPPPAGLSSPLLWGTREWIESAFDRERTTITKAERRNFQFRFRSAQHLLDVFRTCYGPLVKAFEALEERAGNALALDILDLVKRFNTSGDSTVIVPGEYLEIVGAKH